MTLTSVAIVILLGVVTCAGCRVPPPRVVPENRMSTSRLQCKSGSVPPIGVSAISRVGEAMYTEDDYCWTERPKKPDPQAPKAVVPDGLQWARGNGQRATIAPGTQLTRQFYNGTYAYCTPGGVFRDIFGPSRVVCLADRNADGLFDQMTVVAAVPYTTPISPTVYMTPSTGGQRPKVDVEIVEGYRKELVYQGLLNRQVKLLYREYLEQLARPAFFQQVTYDYREGEDIQFQDVRLRIFRASRNDVRYEVLSGWGSGASGSGVDDGEE